ncbi:hypothetical protein D9757_014233 [Collybiopsis confluens]|uniref:Ricin B lectin domain-containing protein n=1 Tax=Collybiopsis confluens TaxID=2823264 RepID=A0A8H5G1E4_9AGAR|nr:hypothetical protein D9757_014233 [Collybiopsis confluens]
MASAKDQWIGLTLAISSSVAIGMSSIIAKKGLNAAAAGAPAGASASDNHAYLKNSIWWLGISTQIIGEIANFTTYTFAPPMLVTPLDVLSVPFSAVAASLIRGESLRHLGRVTGCGYCGPDFGIRRPPSLFALRVYGSGFYDGDHLRYRPSWMHPAMGIHLLVGSVSVMSIKAFGIAIKLTIGGNNQFLRPSTYVFGIALILSAVVQLNYYNRVLDIFSVNIVNPMYYVGFTTATIAASLILFQGFNTEDASGGYTDHGGDNQKWRFKHGQGGRWAIRNVATSQYLGMDGSVGDGTPLISVSDRVEWDIYPDENDSSFPKLNLLFARNTKLAGAMPASSSSPPPPIQQPPVNTPSRTSHAQSNSISRTVAPAAPTRHQLLSASVVNRPVRYLLHNHNHK